MISTFFLVSLIIYSGDYSNYNEEEEDGGEEEEESVCERVVSLLKGGFLRIKIASDNYINSIE